MPHPSFRAVSAFAAALVLTSIGLVVPAAAHADDAGEITWAVQPSSITGPDGRDAVAHTISPGQAVDDYVGISNLGAEPLTVTVYAMDAMMTADGAFSLPPADQTSRDVGTWVGLAGDGSFTIKPNTRLDIPVRITVPIDAEPGDHVGGIVASVLSQAGSADAAPNMAVDRRVGVRVYISVPGQAAPALAVSDVTVSHPVGLGLSAPATITYKVTNSGNVRMGGTARIDAAGPLGAGAVSGGIQDLPEILPGASVTLTRTVDDVFAMGLITATVALDPQPVADTTSNVAGEHVASGSAVTIPWPIAIGAALIALLAILIVRRSRSLRRKLAAADAALAEARAREALPAEDEPAVHPTATRV